MTAGTLVASDVWGRSAIKEETRTNRSKRKGQDNGTV